MSKDLTGKIPEIIASLASSGVSFKSVEQSNHIAPSKGKIVLQRHLEAGTALLYNGIGNVQLSSWERNTAKLIELIFRDDTEVDYFNAIHREWQSRYDKSNSKVDRNDFYTRMLEDEIAHVEGLVARLDSLALIEVADAPVGSLNMAEKNLANLRKESAPQTSPCIFIGHGRSKLWARVDNELNRAMKLNTIHFESEPRVGESIVPILEDMLAKATFAVLVLTKEDETADRSFRARQNVIHEVGLFQGKLGFKSVVILVQSGIEEFTNIAGLQYIPFDGDKIESTFYQLQQTLKREKQI